MGAMSAGSGGASLQPNFHTNGLDTPPSVPLTLHRSSSFDQPGGAPINNNNNNNNSNTTPTTPRRQHVNWLKHMKSSTNSVENSVAVATTGGNMEAQSNNNNNNSSSSSSSSSSVNNSSNNNSLAVSTVAPSSPPHNTTSNNNNNNNNNNVTTFSGPGNNGVLTGSSSTTSADFLTYDPTLEGSLSNQVFMNLTRVLLNWMNEILFHAVKHNWLSSNNSSNNNNNNNSNSSSSNNSHNNHNSAFEKKKYLVRQILKQLLCVLQRNGSAQSQQYVYTVVGSAMSRSLTRNVLSEYVLDARHFLGDFLAAALSHYKVENYGLRCSAVAAVAATLEMCDTQATLHKVITQATLGMNKLLSGHVDLVSQLQKKENMLQALRALAEWAKQSHNTTAPSGHCLLPHPPHFIADVAQLSQTLVQLLLDVSKLAEFTKEDSESYADLFWSIARSYACAPALRITWLLGLQNLHLEAGNSIEAAFVAVHVNALIAEFLRIASRLTTTTTTTSSTTHSNTITTLASSIGPIKIVPPVVPAPPAPVSGAPVTVNNNNNNTFNSNSNSTYNSSSHAFPLVEGCGSFLVLTPNARQESLNIPLITLREGGASVEHTSFSEEGLLQNLHLGVELCKRAELWECCPLLYRMLLGIYEERLDYKHLAICHADLGNIYREILRLQGQPRYLGSYYRIAFYGRCWGEDDGIEYIYKEPRITRLGEIQERLQIITEKRFGIRATIISDSSSVERSKLTNVDSYTQPYIQITSVQPYLTPVELQQRKTWFERNTSLNQFVFVTPINWLQPKLQAQTDSVKEQGKRKTVLVTEFHFPYITKRVRVISKYEILRSPIENSTENVQYRTDTITEQINNIQPVAKILQSVLQGSLLLQVHAGPKEICKVFLATAERSTYTNEQITALKRALSEFLRVCKEALDLNRTLIGPDQIRFQEEMETGFREMVDYMDPFLTQ
jgi:hypothetical protein